MDDAKTKKASEKIGAAITRLKGRVKAAKDGAPARAERKRLKRAQRKRRRLVAAGAPRKAATPS